MTLQNLYFNEILVISKNVSFQFYFRLLVGYIRIHIDQLTLFQSFNIQSKLKASASDEFVFTPNFACLHIALSEIKQNQIDVR